jgi:hypothetical protein
MSLAAALCLPPGSGLAQAPTSSAEAACCGPVSPQGRRLIALIDSMHVEQAWLAHEHVNWETGAPDRAADYAGPGKATHCSAFAAAVGARLGVYMLRPPQHSQILLASAQTAWFHSGEGVRQGWRPLDGADRAQQAQAIANRGDLVVIAYESPDPHRPGHIVIVRPADKTAQALATDGPQIAMAGTRNYSDFIAAKAFRSHPGAWPDGVRYYWHAVDWSRIGG